MVKQWLFGVLLLVNIFLVLYPLDEAIIAATAIFDVNPPVIVATTPHDKSLGSLSLTFLADKKISCRLQDAGVGVLDVVYNDFEMEMQTGIVELHLTLRDDGVSTKYDGVWEADFPAGVIYPTLTDVHFSFEVWDEEGNYRDVTGDFYVYDALQGTWLLKDGNDPSWKQVYNPSDVFVFNDLTLHMRFIKAVGVEDANITCVVREASGLFAQNLNYQGGGIWEGSRTFTDGTYTLNFEASDGVSIVVMSLYQMELDLFNQDPFNIPFSTGQIIALLCLPVTIFLAYKAFKESGEH